MIAFNSTGYFGRASGADARAMATKVHYVKPDGKVACGYKPHKTMKYQWCAYGQNYGYLECQKCKDWINKASK